MITGDIVFNEKYNIILSKRFNSVSFNVNIIGKTNKNLIINHDDKFNIYETFYKPNNLGLTTYYNTITDETNIYICNVITSLEPLTISEDKIFIPESIIDKSISGKLIPVSLFNLNISNIFNRYTTPENRDIYLAELMGKVDKALKTLIEFNVNDINLKQVNDLIYMTEDNMTEIEVNRVKLYNEYKNRIHSEIRENELKVSNYNKKLRDVEQQRLQLASEIERTKRINDHLQNVYGIEDSELE